MSKRRGLLGILGAGVLAAPLAVFAQQQAKVWRVGFLAERHVDFVESDNFYGAFRRGLRELGYVDGKNLLIEWRSAEGHYERLPALAAELVDLKVDVIVTASTRATDAARKATTAIPIVMGSVTDPVGSGFVKSLYTEMGILMSYGPSLTDQWWRVATYVAKILKGARPADLPIEQPTKFDLVINGNTAKAFGLTIPYALRISTTKVIE